MHARNAVPHDAVQQDLKLEARADRAGKDLAAHRWHWTLDPGNPDRVSFHAYGAAVGRSFTSIRRQATGYDNWLKDPSVSLTDHIARANMSEQRALTAQAVADAYGIKVATVAVNHSDVLAELMAQAQRKVEPGKVEFADALSDVMEFHKKAKKAREEKTTRMKARHGIRFVAVEAEINRSHNAVTRALNEAHGVEWTEHEEQLLRESVARLKAVVSLLEMSVAGVTDIDWDHELAELNKQAG